MDTSTLNTLSGSDLQSFLALAEPAVDQISTRFSREQGELYGRFGKAGEQACRQDIRFTIDFLRPAVEFGLTQAFIDYIGWLKNVLATRQIPADHVSLMLTWLADFYQSELAPAAAETVRHVLEIARDAPEREDAQIQSISSHCPAAWDGAQQLKELLLDGRETEARALLQNALQSGSSLIDIELHLLQPALYQIGVEWQQNLISVAQEHLATATATSLMAQLAMTVEYAASNGRRVLLACVAGNQHAVGLRIVGDAFEASGWDVRYLGTDVPTAALLAEARRYAPDLIALSVSMPYQLDSVRSAMTALRESLGDSMPAVMIGGLAINGFPSVTRELGTSLTAANAASAVDLANQAYDRRT